MSGVSFLAYFLNIEQPLQAAGNLHNLGGITDSRLGTLYFYPHLDEVIPSSYTRCVSLFLVYHTDASIMSADGSRQ